MRKKTILQLYFHSMLSVRGKQNFNLKRKSAVNNDDINAINSITVVGFITTSAPSDHK
jgi:hypothetical protein